MSFTPGMSVRDVATGRVALVLDGQHADYPGFAHLEWSNGDRTYTNPDFLEQLGGDPA